MQSLRNKGVKSRPDGSCKLLVASWGRRRRSNPTSVAMKQRLTWGTRFCADVLFSPCHLFRQNLRNVGVSWYIPTALLSVWFHPGVGGPAFAWLLWLLLS